jgi:hypothetical protein
MVVGEATVVVAPPTPLLPRVHGPPTSTPGSAPFKCGRVPGVVGVQQPHLRPQAMLADALPYAPPPQVGLPYMPPLAPLPMHLPYQSLRTHMGRTRDRDSHTRGRMLDYSIRAPSPLPYHMGYMVGLAEGGSSSMVLELRSWVQFSPAMHFLSLCVIILT